MENKRTAMAAVAVAMVLLPAAARRLDAQMASERASAGAAAAAETITATDLERIVDTLAADSMRGRDTPSPELLETARYVAERFRAAGLQPGTEDGYLQMYPLSRIRPGPAAQQKLVLRGPDGEHALAYGTDYFIQPTALSGRGEGPLVPVRLSEAVDSAEGGVAIVPITAANIRQVLGGGLRSSLQSLRPSAVLLALDLPDEQIQQLRGFLTGDRVVEGEVSAEAMPVAFLARRALPEALAASLFEGKTPAPGWTAEIRTAGEASRFEAPNTVGILEGSDPTLREEYVLFSAHMDHLGVGRPLHGDSIYNGADDNASGTATIVELAQAFGALDPKPRRSLVFLTVSGEEKGLLGSRWYAEHPVVPLEKTVADLNIDMIGRNWKDTVAVIGKPESTLGALVDSISAVHPELSMTPVDDPWPEQSFYTRSDHYNFARRGVPILFFFSGVHEDYHRPGDEPQKLEYEKMSRIGRLIFYLGLSVADADGRPQWDPAAYARVVGSGGS